MVKRYDHEVETQMSP